MLQHHPSHTVIKNADLKLYCHRIFLSSLESKLTITSSNSASHKRSIIKPCTVEGFEKAGMGRIVRFASSQSLLDVIERIGRGLGNPKGFPIAVPQGVSIDSIRVSSVGICAGSGASLLSGLDVDLLFTGELAHHEALAAIEKGQSVITLFHSNTERGFLHSVLRLQLQAAVRKEWDQLRKAEAQKNGNDLDDEYKDALDDDFVSVELSEKDRDPYGIVISNAEQ